MPFKRLGEVVDCMCLARTGLAIEQNALLRCLLESGQFLPLPNEVNHVSVEQCHRRLWQDYLLTLDGSEVVDGYFQLPEGPGWGIELDLDFIRQHPPRTVDGVIQDPGLNMFIKADWNQRDGN